MMEANTEAKYREPQHFPLDYLRRLAAAKRDEAEDEIWALRENPNYFQEVLEENLRELCDTSLKVQIDMPRNSRVRMEAHNLQEAC